NFVTEEPWPASPDPLTRVFYSHREYEDANLKSLLKAQMDLFARLDVPENSFGYKVGRDLGILPSDIVLVGQDGVKVETIPAQFGRIFEMHTSTLPPYVLLSFTANDMCDESVLTESVDKWSEHF